MLYQVNVALKGVIGHVVTDPPHTFSYPDCMLDVFCIYIQIIILIHVLRLSILPTGKRRKTPEKLEKYFFRRQKQDSIIFVEIIKSRKFATL